MRPMSRRRDLRLAALLASVLAACSGPPASPVTDASVGPDTTTPPVSASVSASPSTTAATPAGPTGPPTLALEPVADGLASPISIATAPDGWLVVNEQAGRVIAVHPGRGERAEVVDLSDRILAGGEQGLLGLALHPDWPADSRAWVHYTAADTDAVVAELSGSQEVDGPPTLDAGSERILLEIPDSYPNHNGGQLAFGPDGYLWIGLGDGGGANDPLASGQDGSDVLGSLLRIDVAEPGSYSIPPDNPFADGAAGAPEVHAYGLRNPWRFSFDPETDELWIADVGQNVWEEVNRIDAADAAGANFGWSLMEGANCFNAPTCEMDGLVLPLAEYGRNLGCSVTGGHVYRGSGVAGLAGWYVFGDYCTGLLFAVAADAPQPSDGSALAPQQVGESGANVSSFGVDSDGELYLVDHGGGVLSRVVAAGG
jgi:glucose/arabinose dehydrogenase